MVAVAMGVVDREQLLTRVFMDAVEPIILEDINGIILDVNTAAVRVYGWAREELMGKPVKTLVPEERHGQAGEILRRCLAGEMVGNVEGLRITKSGAMATVLLTLSRLLGDDGEPIAVVSFATDITELVEAQLSLEHMSRVFRDGTDPILVEDLEGVVIDMNREAARIYGFERDELIGQSIKRIVPEDCYEQADDLLRRCRSGDEVRAVEGMRITREGERMPVLLTLSLLRGDDGEPVAIASFATDITEQKALEAELHAKNQDLEARVEERTTELESAKQRLEQELRVARALTSETARHHQLALLGESIAIRAVRDAIKVHAGATHPLLLTGPRGAGQEAVAHAVHMASGRRERPFIYVDCAHVSGSGTKTLFSHLGSTVAGAVPERVGRANLAEGGTLYLEGLELLRPEAQQALANFLTANEPDIDVRIIAYGGSDIQAEAQRGAVDPKLVSALSGYRLNVPSLAERREDLPVLAKRIVRDRARSLGKVAEDISERSLERISEYPWPDNLRELRSVLERAVVLATGSLVEVNEDTLGSGPQIGGYRLTERIGAGGMGDVWLAKHALLARPAAVKLIRDDMLDVSGDQRDLLLQRFQREARATASLRAPNTVELYDFGVTPGGALYYVMEYLEGIDVATLIEEHGRVPASRAVHLLQQACDSLAEAHERGLVHRDIKPANLFVCRLGVEADFLKVVDFGIVRNTREDSQMTATGTLPGTPAYLAPELLMTTAPATPAADIYALGCVAFSLLTGEAVFEAPNPMGLMMKHSGEAPRAPSTLAEGIPEGLDEIVLHMLAKDPASRPSSAREVRRRLAGLTFATPWDRNAADRWWNQHQPGIGLIERSPTLRDSLSVEGE